jgi:hypothetical protein
MTGDRLPQVHDPSAHLADVVVALGVRRQAQRATGALQERVGEKRVGSRPLPHDPVLQQAMGHDHVGPDRLRPGRRLLQDELAEVRYELEIESADEGAGRARARGGPAHLLEPQPERHVGCLDHVEEAFGVREGRRRA